ncbi:MAG TPA: CDP-diacylglycerol--glycerol-3-phosphate 3-phosphatidyltransferase [Firmicutes bacterium]|nr:CDP-diacylglycerol--glycerol-3-phosphate 3-phosphatidyltransferase [Bacillota bacterium]HHT42621.1 CDP-diacylglycerol--glycerol-3-phosphate 3-phosphatidyltransferase [Bacillota bacterium]
MNLPNVVTLIRITLVPLFVYLYLINPGEMNLSAAFVFLLAAVTDGLDGYLARRRREITRFGQLIDPIADKLLISAALLALVEAGLVSTWLALIILGREFAVSGLRILAAAEGKVIAASLWGKVKTVTQISAVMAFFLGISWAPVVMWLAVVVTIISGVRYFQKAQDVLKSSMR